MSPAHFAALKCQTLSESHPFEADDATYVQHQSFVFSWAPEKGVELDCKLWGRSQKHVQHGQEKMSGWGHPKKERVCPSLPGRAVTSGLQEPSHWQHPDAFLSTLSFPFVSPKSGRKARVGRALGNEERDRVSWPERAEGTSTTQGRQVKDGEKSLSESLGAAAGWGMSDHQHRSVEAVSTHPSGSPRHNAERNEAKELHSAEAVAQNVEHWTSKLEISGPSYPTLSLLPTLKWVTFIHSMS